MVRVLKGCGGGGGEGVVRSSYVPLPETIFLRIDEQNMLHNKYIHSALNIRRNDLMKHEIGRFPFLKYVIYSQQLVT